MTSSDREILLDLKAEQQKMRQDFSEFKAVVLEKFTVLETELTLVKHDVANLQTSVYWVLAAIGIFIAAVALHPFGKGEGGKPSQPPQPVIIQQKNDDFPIKMNYAQLLELLEDSGKISHKDKSA